MKSLFFLLDRFERRNTLFDVYYAGDRMKL